MIQMVVNGIAQALNTEFSDVTIYADQIRQGFDEPAFYIKDITSSEEQIIGNRYMRHMSFDVHYFPQNKVEPQTEIRGITEGLYRALEYIGAQDSLTRGRRMRHEVESDVLHFLVDYDVTITRQQTPEDPMDGLAIIQRNA